MRFKVRCPECQEKFASAVWPPKACPACGHIPDKDDDDRVCMPSISTARKAVDSVYRAMEEGSNVRAQVAAEITGASAAEMAGLKITNLNDRRDAEIAAMPVRNDVTQRMDAMQQAGLPIGFSGQANLDAVGAGPVPYSGAHARVNLQAAMGHSSQTVEPLEVQNPGYRRRA
jgi:hypothetical protein